MRNLGTNRIYLHRPAANAVTIFQLNGGIDPDEMKQRIASAMNRHEQLKSRIVSTADGEGGYEPISEAIAEVEVETYEPAESEDEESLLDIAMEWAVEAAALRLDLAKGELMRHLLLTDGNESVWAIVSHYLAGDAYSIQYLARDVLEGHSESLAWQDVSVEVPDVSALALPARKKLQNMNRKWEKTKKVFLQEDFRRMHRNFHDAYPIHYHYREFDEELTEILQTVARSRNASFTAILAAAFVQASAEPDVVSVSVSTRPESYEGVGIYIGGVGLKPPKRQDYWGMVEQFTRTLADEGTNPLKLFHTDMIAGSFAGSLLDAGYYAAFDAFKDKTAQEMQQIYGLSSPGTGTQLNNLKQVPLPSDQVARVYVFPPLTPSYTRVVGVATVDKRLTFTLAAYREEDYQQTVLDRVVELLREIAGQ